MYLDYLFKGRIFRALVLTSILVSGVGLKPKAYSQDVADKIIAIIGRNRILLKSDLEIQVAQIKQQQPNFTDSMTCNLLQQMILQKMLMEQAERDSVAVTEEDVEGQLDNRIRYFTQLYGSKEKLEEVSGKTIYQLKDEYRDIIRDQMLAEKVQGQVLEHVKITPSEVEEFFNNIPKDSLPAFPAAVEVGQVVIAPPVNYEMEEYAHKKISDLRKRIIDGELSFETAAGFYSEDPGSRDNGGRYNGVTRNGVFVAEFVTAAFKLQNGEISPVIKTQFGYHIIQMVDRKGEEVDLRHILVKPTVTSSDFDKSLVRLDSIRNLLVSGKISFSEAVGKFSTDEAAKRTGGMIANPSTGNTELEISDLDRALVLMLDTLQPGQYSAPHIFFNEQHEKSCRIVYLRSRTDPHKANLKQDYGKIQEVALSKKKQERMQSWVVSKLPTIYLWVAPEYRSCKQMEAWVTSEEEP